MSSIVTPNTFFSSDFPTSLFSIEFKIRQDALKRLDLLARTTFEDAMSELDNVTEDLSTRTLPS